MNWETLVEEGTPITQSWQPPSSGSSSAAMPESRDAVLFEGWRIGNLFSIFEVWCVINALFFMQSK